MDFEIFQLDLVLCAEDANVSDYGSRSNKLYRRMFLA